MEHYLINSTASLFVLWLFYKLTLENSSWHHVKRYYLLLATIFSLLIPFVVVNTVVVSVDRASAFLVEQPIITDLHNEQPTETFDWTAVLLSVYAVGILIMSWRFVKNIIRFRVENEDEIKPYNNYQLILRHAFTVPHSFINRIFVSKNQYANNQIPELVLEHEKVHLDQRHSIDVLMIELLLILLWFNPVLYLLRYSIKLNHEFLADKAVLDQGVDTTEYQETLLNYSQHSHYTSLANTFNFPIIKKRFRIMKTKTSNTSLFIRSVALIPVLAILIISCGKEETKFQEVEQVIEEVEVPEQNKKIIVVDASTTEGYLKIDNEDYLYKINDDQINIYNKFGELQDFEKQGYTVSKEIIEEKEVTEELGNLSAIEYINQHKEELNYYLRNDQIDADNAISIIEKVGQNGVEISPDSNGIMSIKILETNDNKKLLPPPPPPPPLTKSGYIKVDNKIHYYTTKDNDGKLYDRDGNVIDIKNKRIEQIDPKDLPPPPPPAPEHEDLVKYNLWAKEINAKNKLATENGNAEYPIVQLKEVEKYKAIYNKLTKAQKANVQPWPNLPPPPPATNNKM
ncbi:hypothetical protein AAT17_05580 [Nonlabens sp. MIC269]|uniref:M56 family metallopeptidase n=1 Tax=Nonlabens sp. MIC269 TaxID=1476901 RepID=UPI000721AD3F|nr:M56 family metallopeptidase [Nonlabens sp. MIC269]ALM20733.1 hypothetical protein AAT17_05580 [Nonlabens sp. MIC269]